MPGCGLSSLLMTPGHVSQFVTIFTVSSGFVAEGVAEDGGSSVLSECLTEAKGTRPVMKWMEYLEKHTGPLKVREVAELLGVSRQKVYKMVANGEIPYLRIRGCIRFLPEQLIGWVRIDVIHSELALPQRRRSA
jgi:excisionase family DNA binding protein